MHLLLGKKQIVLAALAVALSLAVFVNWYYSDSGTRISDAVINGEDESVNRTDGRAQYVSGKEAEYFSSLRLSRDKAHAEALEELKAVIAMSDGESGISGEASAALSEVGSVKKMETDIENLVSGKTGEECVAVISGNTVEVIVAPQNLNDTSVLAISDVVSQICGGKYENIKISGPVG